MDINKLKERKKELGYTNERISELSGVPLGTVQKIFGGETKSPRRATYLAIKDALYPPRDYSLDSGMSYVREEILAYELDRIDKKQGEYTIEDYYALPDEVRVELIDGVIYYMTAPTTVHQIIAGDIHNQLWNCVEEHDEECFPLISPINVQLDRDIRTMVQPDVIIACDRELITKKVIYGAPEFVLEVLSPSTRRKDQLVKLNKYLNAGCKEYWIVDPDKEKVMVYDFTEENWPDVYTFSDKVPVNISDGKCEIDFGRIKKKIDKIEKYFLDEELE